MDDITGSESVNYIVDGGIGNPQNAEVDMIEPNKVYLLLNNALANGNTYNLTVENVTDKAGNQIISQSTIFDFLVPEPIELAMWLSMKYYSIRKSGGRFFRSLQPFVKSGEPCRANHWQHHT